MAGRSLFGRGGDDDAPDASGRPQTNEGVRLIGPDEAEKAVERGDAARRRSGDAPRYGDRPSSPPPGPKPTLRFPLPDSEDLGDIARPKAAAVPDRPPSPDPDPSGPLEEPPVISLDPPSGEVQMPHWTEPATGEVPRVIVGDAEPSDDDEKWAAFSQGPRWRDQHEAWEGEADLVADLAHDDDEQPMGALDTSDRLSHEDYLTFEDLDVPTAEAPRVARGSADDPIRIGSGGPERRPEPPVPPNRQRSERGGRAGGPSPTGRTARPRPAAGRAGDPAGAARRRPPGDGRPPAGGDATAAPEGRNVPQAAAVGAAIFIAALVLFSLGPGFAMAIVLPIVVLAGIEYFNALRQRGDNPPTLLGLVAIGALPWAAFARGEGAIPLVLFLLIAFGVLWYLLGVGGGHPVQNLGATLLAVVHVGVLGSFAALLLRIGPVGGSSEDQGVSFLLLAVVAAVAYDVGGFFLGRQFGHTPLSEVSPNKTREGLLAGMAASVLAVLILRYFPLFGVGETLEFGHVLLFAVFCAIAAPIGDLAESLVKRDLGIKDMGSILPGHGGVLDRFDALLFVLPTAYYVIRLAFAG